MQDPFRKTKGKVRWSKLYSFACLRPCTAVPAPVQTLIGQPGFSRIVFCNEPQLHKAKPYKYPNNYVSTTKYNVFTFLPKALFEQFRRVANFYFLLAALFSLTPATPLNSITLIGPLVLVVGISMLKELVEDWHRFLQDFCVNSRIVKAHIGNGIFEDKEWKFLCVGDVVKVNKNENFPSDLLLLSSSYEDGICYVETMNLDGETSLKVKRSLEPTLYLDNEIEFRDFKAIIRCEDPNPNLYSFVGNLEFKNESCSITPTQVLLRDSILRNTDYIYGVAIFTGPDTKVVRNSTKSPSKRSRIERQMDYVIYVLFVILVVISLISSFGSLYFTQSTEDEWLYRRLNEGKNQYYDPSKPLKFCFNEFIRALILYGYLIPISLYVSIEIVKVLQAVLINKDKKMYDETTGKSVEARTSNLNEELGQVEMILSDKTGTLTCNQMEFRKCSIAGVSYGGDVNEVDLEASKRMQDDIDARQFSLKGNSCMSQSFELPEFNRSIRNSNICCKAEDSIIKHFNFKDDRLMNKNWTGQPNSFEIVMFFRVMALCHTGIPIADDTQTNKLKYEAESPEEVAFLIASQEFGFKFCQRTQSVLLVKEIDPSSGMAVEREYKLLNLLEFSSYRKRMSVIVSSEDGQIFLLCKGADSIIYDKLAESGSSYLSATSSHLSDYAEDGLRTLVFAYRIIEPTEYQRWNSIFTKAKATIGSKRDELLERASELIEKDLILLGAAAVEDKLQNGVPECIDKLAQAGMKLWLLTGDKKETAINIGFACSLLRQDMRQFHLNLSREIESTEQFKAMREEILHQIEVSHQAINEESTKGAPFALVIDGKALEIALQSDVKDQFLRLAVNCASVICCRVSPKQKALITRSVKRYTGKTTLAIGDGANDVGMIQEADIGVGISGMEGMQAVMASDFSLPQFRFLERLLIVHGHWCYKRISKMILYFVYKNIVFGLTILYYEVYMRFSGDVLYDGWYMVLFNVLLTSLPVISLGVLEQDVSADVCLQFPGLYQQGQKNVDFSWIRIIGWMINGAFSSLAVFLLNICALCPSAFTRQGQVVDTAQLGATMYTCVIWTVNCQIALIISHFTWIQHLLIWGSILSWYVSLYAYGALPPKFASRGFHLLIKEIGPAPVFWLVTPTVVVLSLLPYFIHIAIQKSFYPMDDHVLQEMKYHRKDVTESPMWLKEQNNSKKKTHVGFSARVNAKIKHLKEQLHQPLTSSLFYR